METLIALLLSTLIAISGGSGSVSPSDITPIAGGEGGHEISGESADNLRDWSRSFR